MSLKKATTSAGKNDIRSSLKTGTRNGKKTEIGKQYNIVMPGRVDTGIISLFGNTHAATFT